MKTKIYIILLTIFTLSCEDYLNEKPKKNLVVPKTLQDLRALLDASSIGMNEAPSLPLLSTDDLLVTESGWNNLSNAEKSAYTWNDELADYEVLSDWYYPYLQVLYANVVLEELDNVEVTQNEISTRNDIKGSAFFYRANAFFNLMQVFAAPYEEQTANEHPGIPLRLSSDIDKHYPRSTIKQCYTRIIDDLGAATDLLPEKATIESCPSKTAALALLAKVYLSMEDYEMAKTYAQQVLDIKNDLINYSELIPTDQYPIPAFNDEVIFVNQMILYRYTYSNEVKVNPDLYNLYAAEDLRKQIYFNEAADGTATYKGSYMGNYLLFAGLATDEIYLILAESQIRTGDVPDGIETLNKLLKTRYLPGEYTDITTTDPEEALRMVLEERRKELAFRGTRWSDLRRLNKDSRFAKILERTIDGEEHQLQPNDSRYMFLIPPDEIKLGNLAQNQR